MRKPLFHESLMLRDLRLRLDFLKALMFVPWGLNQINPGTSLTIWWIFFSPFKEKRPATSLLWQEDSLFACHSSSRIWQMFPNGNAQ